MPTNDREEVNIKDLPIAVELSNSDTMILIQNGTYTRRVDLGDLATYLLENTPISDLATNTKYVVGAINEVAGVEVTGVLPAYSKTLILQDPRIKSTSTVRVLTENYTVAPTNVVVASGSATLVFEPRDTAINVKVKVS